MKHHKTARGLIGTRFRFIVAVSLAVALIQGAKAAEVQTIQIGAYDSHAEATAALGALGSKISPAFIYDSGAETKRYKLCLGHFTVYADAHAYRSKLKPGAFPGNWITSVDVAATELTPPVLPVEMPFKIEPSTVPDSLGEEVLQLGGFAAEPEPAPALVDKSPAQMTKEELEQVGMAVASHPFRAAPALEEYLASHANDPLANKARLRLARVLGRGQNIARAETLLAHVIKNGNAAERITARFLLAHAKYNKNSNNEAYESFRALASDLSVPANIRRKCMRLAAGTAHRNGQLQDAWLCFTQIAELAPDAESVGEARLQLAGLALELAGRQKGTYEEARALCTAVAEDPATPASHQATARLMYLETFYHEKRYAECLAAADSFLQQHGEAVREVAVAKGFRGMALLYQERFSEAKAALEEVAGLQLDPTQRFARLDPRPRAAIWLAYIAARHGDTGERDRWIAFIQNDYPDGEEARAIPGLFPGLN